MAPFRAAENPSTSGSEDALDRNADVDKHGNKAEAPINSSSRVFGLWEDVQTEERKP